MNKSIINFSVEPGTDPKRIESLLRDIFPDVSRAKWREEIEAGLVRVNDRVAKVGMTLKGGDFVSIEKTDEIVPGLRFEGKIQGGIVPIVFEDEYLFVFDKPRAMHSILQRSEDLPTLSDYAVLHCESSLNASPKVHDGGLVQRLDYFTTGLCIVAKSREVWDELHRQFTNHEVVKKYQAYVPASISRPSLQRAVSDGLFLESNLLETKDTHSIVQVSLRDGSRHIVRRSFKEIGFPLLGDTQYGGSDFRDEGFFLRCVKMELTHPVTKVNLILETRDLVNS